MTTADRLETRVLNDILLSLLHPSLGCLGLTHRTTLLYKSFDQGVDHDTWLYSYVVQQCSMDRILHPSSQCYL